MIESSNVAVLKGKKNSTMGEMVDLTPVLLPSSDPPSSAASTTSSFLESNRWTRQKMAEQAKAATLAQATSQAIIAAQSLMLTGASESTALTTARAAARSVLAPKNASILSRRKLNQQVEVVASMALVAAQNAVRAGDQKKNIYDISQIPHPSSFMFNTPFGHGGTARASESESNGDSYSRNTPPSVIHRQLFQPDDRSTLSGSAQGERAMDISFESSRLNSQNETDSGSSRPSQSSPSPKRRQNLSETVAKLLSPLEDDDMDKNGSQHQTSESARELSSFGSNLPSYSSEDVNGADESYSSTSSGPVAQQPQRMDALSTIFRSFVMCGAEDDIREPSSLFGTRDEGEGERDESEMSREDDAPYRGSDFTVSETGYVDVKSSESSSLCNDEIIRALASLERERMHRAFPPGQPQMKNTGIRKSIEKAVLRAMAKPDSKPTSPVAAAQETKEPEDVTSPAKKTKSRWRLSKK